MPNYLQAGRQLAMTTPLGKDVLLLSGLTGREGISQLFSFQLTALAELRKEVPFDKLLGQKVTAEVRLPNGKVRFFNGLVNRLGEGDRTTIFTSYHLDIVPQFWLLTKRVQSRIFQHISVPDILKKVLAGLDVVYELQGTFHPRDFCAQYRESDFHFASRLMEEEGIFYFFKHTADGHKMVVANSAASHPDVPEPSKVIFKEVNAAEEEKRKAKNSWSRAWKLLAKGGIQDGDRVSTFEKVQFLRSGKVTLWDHSFELPGKHLEAEKAVVESAQVGKVTHKLKVGGNDQLELYDYPGGYAGRIDGIDRGGGERPAELQKIFEDNQRTAAIRMQQETAAALVITGSSNCAQFTAGHKFTLEKHFNGDGQYVLTSVEHSAKLGADYRSGEMESLVYQNRFTCVPFAVPYRPARVAPRPTVQGTQTAIVVGPAGEEIFTDKYGRVKVQFPWDREGKNDADSACWVRVGTIWAGKQWGVIHIPRIGQEVIVDFLEGDPDQPIIIGSVYNADQMPPYPLPDNRTQSGIKSRSSLGGTEQNFNEFRFEDKKGQEQVYLHAERNLDSVVEVDESRSVGHDRSTTIGNDETLTVKHDRTTTIGNDETLTVKHDRKKTVHNDESTDVHGNRTEHVHRGHETVTIHTGNRTVDVNTGHDMLNVLTGNQGIKVNTGHAMVRVLSGSRYVMVDSGSYELSTPAQNVIIKAGDKIIEIGNNEVNISSAKITITASKEITLGVGGNTITINTKGITTGATKITTAAIGVHEISGAIVKIN